MRKVKRCFASRAASVALALAVLMAGRADADATLIVASASGDSFYSPFYYYSRDSAPMAFPPSLSATKEVRLVLTVNSTLASGEFHELLPALSSIALALGSGGQNYSALLSALIRKAESDDQSALSIATSLLLAHTNASTPAGGSTPAPWVAASTPAAWAAALVRGRGITAAAMYQNFTWRLNEALQAAGLTHIVRVGWDWQSNANGRSNALAEAGAGASIVSPPPAAFFVPLGVSVTPRICSFYSLSSGGAAANNTNTIVTYVDKASGVCRLCTECAGQYQLYACRTADTVCVGRCPAGFYARVGGAIGSRALGSCTACRAGFFSASDGQTACTACPAGTFSAASESTGCTACAAGTTSLAGSFMCFDEVSVRTHARPGPKERERERREHVEVREGGHIKEIRFRCGNARRARDKTARESESMNHDLTVMNRRLLRAGKKSPAHVGTTTITTTATCAAAIAKKAKTTTMTKRTKKGDEGGRGLKWMLRRMASSPAIVLLASMALMVDPARAQTCIASPGSYCPSGTTGDPATCPAGYYCSGDGSSTACPVGTYNSLAGQSSVSACSACAANRVALAVGQAECQLCAAGSVYATASSCSACSAGTYAASGETACTSCAAGTVSGAGAGSCSNCRPGTYSSGTGSAVCTACPIGYYTYTSSGPGQYTAVWGATSAGQCAANPSTPASPTICLPGTRLVGATCVACPVGYYCPEFTLYTIGNNAATNNGKVRACPAGHSTAGTGGVVQGDCVANTPLVPLTFAQCAVSPGDVSALTSLNVKAVTASANTQTVYFATATAVYRLYLQSSTLELLAGAEGIPGGTLNAVGNSARFSSISAIGVDLDHGEASVVVVGDGNSVRLIDVYTRAVTLMGAVGDVGAVGGVALRREPNGGQRWAYVSDSARHRIHAFSVDSVSTTTRAVVGDLGAQPGLQDGSGNGARFNVPMGLGFLERSMNSSRILLVADSANGVIRAVDVVTRVVSTWFAPLDTVTPELSTPVSVAVSSQSSIVYVADSGNARIVAIQMPNLPDSSVKLLTPLALESTSTSGSLFVNAIPYGAVVTGGNNAAAYDQLLVLDSTGHSLEALVENLRANSADGGGSVATCHLPCAVGGCHPLSAAELCGNGFLDAGEQCDNPKAGSGCNATTCTIRAGYTCASGQTTCLNPCVAFEYAPTGVKYCSAECAALTPRTGYTVDEACVETDIDECALNTDTCDENKAECVNVPGSVQCRCFSGFFGDGETCKDNAFAVYTVIDIPAIQSSVIGTANPITLALLQALRAAYAQSISTGVPSNLQTTGTFGSKTAGQLAAMFTSYAMDPSFASTYARMELVVLFETSAIANEAARVADVPGLATALSQSLFASNTGVSIVQAPKVRSHSAATFNSPIIQGGWGMNVTSVTYNRTCQLQGPRKAGFSEDPRGGCWQVEMVYMGGQQMARGEGNGVFDPVKHGKNVLYLPRIERDASSLAALIPAQTLTMASGTYFPCDASASSANGRGIAPAATACCLRSFEQLYRPSYDFQGFLDSSAFNRAVPSSTCSAANGINDTFPFSDVVLDLPSTNGQGTNDLVVGQIEGMPSSEVRLLETIDYTTRTFRVLLVLEEGDLRTRASMAQGVTGVDYNMTFFVGLANFKGTGGSVMTTQNAQQYITVSKSNSLTISTFGANQDPLLSSETMQLLRIKVTDFFNPVKYLYYLKVTFTLPSNFQPPPNGGIVPLSGIRLIKVGGGQTVTVNSADWKQVCASTNNDHIYADEGLQTLVDHAQSQTCIQNDLQMCYPPLQAQSVVSFGLPLPEGFITEADFAAAAANNPSKIQVQMVVQSYDNNARTTLLSSLSMSIEITPLGFTAVCETASASQTLADIIDGSIYIGMATADSEWETAMQKQTGMQVPGTNPDNGLEFATTTVQSSMMSFAALGAPGYFEDARYHGQTVNMYDLFTVNFLEPLGGIKGGPTPNFDAVKTLFYSGKAFAPVVDPVTKNMWLAPTQALLNICPLRPRIGKMACLTKIVSTYKNNVLSRSADDVIEVRINDPSSVTEMQNLVAQMLFSGGTTDYSRQLGAAFHAQLVAKLGLNNRYRKAFVINPVINWHLDAIQATQPGLNPYTVCTKIISIGLITISSASGQQVGRRLLSLGLDDDGMHPEDVAMMMPYSIDSGKPSPSLSGLPLADEDAYDYFDGDEDEPDENEEEGDDASSLTTSAAPSALDPNTKQARLRRGGRRLLSTASEVAALAASQTKTANSLVVNIDAPGYDAVSQLCPRIGADMPNCRMIQFTAQISQSQIENVCRAHAAETLGTILNDGFASNLKADAQNPSNVTRSLLMEVMVNGCPSSVVGAAGRRLLQNTKLVIIVSRVLLKVEGSSSVVDPSRLEFIDFFKNSSVLQQLLGGGAIIMGRTMSPPPMVRDANGTLVNAPPGYTYFGDVNYTFNKVNDTLAKLQQDTLNRIKAMNPAPDGVDVKTEFITDDAFTTEKKIMDNIKNGKSSGGVREASLLLGLNLIIAAALGATLMR